MKRNFIILLVVFTAALFAQKFDVEKFTDPKKYGWEDYDMQRLAREDLETRKQILKLYNDRKQNYSTNIMKSAILPGWGQMSAGRTMRGEIFLASEIILAGTGIYYYDKAMNYYDKYKKATYVEDIKKYYEDAKTPYTISQVVLVAGVVIWAINIFDTISVTAENNSGLWERTVSDYYEKKLTITPLGFTYRF